MSLVLEKLKAKYDTLVSETANWMYANLTGELDKTFVLNDGACIVFKPQLSSVDVVVYTLGTSFFLGTVQKDSIKSHNVYGVIDQWFRDAALMVAKKLLEGGESC